jgi:hypothetical protein
VSDLQSQLDQANQVIQQCQSLLTVLQQRGVIAIVQWIAHSQSDEIRVESAVEQGFMFEVIRPENHPSEKAQFESSQPQKA